MEKKREKIQKQKLKLLTDAYFKSVPEIKIATQSGGSAVVSIKSSSVSSPRFMDNFCSFFHS